MSEKRPTLLITGTGALATLFAARLASSGVDVTLLGTWQEALQAFNTRGTRLTELDGREIVATVRATDDPQACRGAQRALVLVKAWQTERVAAQLATCLAEDGVALSLQNGLGNRETLAAALGPSRVALGVTSLGATLLAPGQSRAGGEGPLSLEAHPGLEALSALLRGAGFRVESVPNATTLVWSKLVINAAINPLTALLGIPNGDLLNRPGARRVMAALAQETATVAGALGVQLAFDDPQQAVEAVARQTAHNRSSMLQDISRGAATEIDAICGAVVRAGRENGVPTPFNWTMWQLLRQAGIDSER